MESTRESRLFPASIFPYEAKLKSANKRCVLSGAAFKAKLSILLQTFQRLNCSRRERLSRSNFPFVFCLHVSTQGPNVNSVIGKPSHVMIVQLGMDFQHAYYVLYIFIYITRSSRYPSIS